MLNVQLWVGFRAKVRMRLMFRNRVSVTCIVRINVRTVLGSRSG